MAQVALITTKPTRTAIPELSIEMPIGLTAIAMTALILSKLIDPTPIPRTLTRTPIQTLLRLPTTTLRLIPPVPNVDPTIGVTKTLRTTPTIPTTNGIITIPSNGLKPRQQIEGQVRTMPTRVLPDGHPAPSKASLL